MYIATGLQGGEPGLPCAEQELGADETVDYTKEDFSTTYKDKPFDVIVDPIGGAAHVIAACLQKAGKQCWHGHSRHRPRLGDTLVSYLSAPINRRCSSQSADV